LDPSGYGNGYKKENYVKTKSLKKLKWWIL
jgi:hypothetical protein